MTDPTAPVAAPPLAAAKTYQPDQPSRLELVGIDDQPLFNEDGTPMTIDLIGADSDVAIAARRAQSNRRLSQGARMKLSAEGLEADGATYLAKLTVGWNLTPSRLIPGIDPGLGEGKVEFTPAAAAALYKHPKLEVIREQPDKFIADRSNFLKA